MRNYMNQTGGRLQSELWAGAETNIRNTSYQEKGFYLWMN